MQQFLRKNISTLLLLAVLLLLLFNPGAKAVVLKTLMRTGIFNARAGKDSSLSHSRTAIPLEFTGSNGIPVNTAALRGKIVFINFWATWCPPCIAEMGAVNSLYNKLKSDPHFVFMLVDADGDLVSAGAFMKKHGYNLPVYRVSGPVPSALYSGTLPTTLIIDTSGVVVQRHEGIANYDTQKMEAFMKSLAPPLVQ